MTDKPIDDRVFRAPKEYEGKLYVAIYATQVAGEWAYMSMVRDSHDDFVRKQMQFMEESAADGALPTKKVCAFPEVNMSFWIRAEKMVDRLNTDKDARKTPPDLVTLQDIVGKA